MIPWREGKLAPEGGALLPLRGKWGEGRCTLIDANKLAWASQWKWYITHSQYKSSIIEYVVRDELVCGHTSRIRVARELLGLPRSPGNYSTVVDHINNYTLDNRVANLREITREHSARHVRKTNSLCASLYKGVRRDRAKWNATIRFYSKKVHIANFASELAAALAYDEAAEDMFGKYAITNRMLGLLPPEYYFTEASTVDEDCAAE